ncbi:MAG: hypothetical protein IPL42_00075 [Saprospiraceae bacterium]|nr:hypothetical protein [Saprospiraceae bacterium]
MTAKLTADKDFTTSTDRRPAYNSTLPKVAVSCFVGQFCGYINFSASMKVCGGNRHLRQAAKLLDIPKRNTIGMQILPIIKL